MAGAKVAGLRAWAGAGGAARALAAQLRCAQSTARKHAAAVPLEPFARELSNDPVPQRFEWWFEFDVPSAGVPVTDSLVLVLQSPDGKIVARCAARM